MKKLLSIALSIITTATFVLGGCFASADDSASTNKTLMGQVTAVSGSSITLALISENMPTDNETQPSGAPDNGSTPPEVPDDSETAPSEAPDGSETAPSGAPDSSESTSPEAPQNGDRQQMTSSLTLTGETQTITVSDSTSILLDDMGQKSTGSISDISKGSILKITLTNDEVTEIDVMANVGTAEISATASTASVSIDSTSVSFQSYNIAGNNYFKLRDVADVLTGTSKQFEVGWDSENNAISLTSGSPYTAVGGELTAADNASSSMAELSTANVLLDGTSVNLMAYNIGGNNYFKLRDIASILDFGVTWDGTTNTIGISTSTGYSEETA